MVSAAGVTDAAYRMVYWCGYRAARVVWGVTRPSSRGALVAVWHAEQILLIRNSYRPEWTLPGGGIEAGEAAVAAAARELGEELGFEPPVQALRQVFAAELFWDNRHDHVTIFELAADRRPEIRIDNREVVKSRYFRKDELAGLNLQPHVRMYLAAR